MQNKILAWDNPVDVINFPGVNTSYEVGIEVFEDASTNMIANKISLISDIPNLDVGHYLNDVAPYTRFRVMLRSKTNWAMSSERAVKEFFTSGISASEPGNFRAFWSPVEEVENL